MNRNQILEQVLLLLIAQDFINMDLRSEYANILELNGKKKAAKKQRDFVLFVRNFLKKNKGGRLRYLTKSKSDKQIVYAMDSNFVDKKTIFLWKRTGKIEFVNYIIPAFMVKEQTQKKFNSRIKIQRNHRLQIRFQRIKEGLPHT